MGSLSVRNHHKQLCHWCYNVRLIKSGFLCVQVIIVLALFSCMILSINSCKSDFIGKRKPGWSFFYTVISNLRSIQYLHLNFEMKRPLSDHSSTTTTTVIHIQPQTVFYSSPSLRMQPAPARSSSTLVYFTGSFIATDRQLKSAEHTPAARQQPPGSIKSGFLWKTSGRAITGRSSCSR